VVELRPPLPLLHELVRLTGRGQQLRRAERLPQPIAGLESYIAGTIKRHATYEVSTLSVPVIAPDGTVALALNLFGFDEPIAGDEVLRLGRVSLVAAQRLARQLDAPER
jgi:DNA-binding IclR family transcriptional regulator